MKLKLVKNTEELVLLEVIFEDVMDRMSTEGFSGKETFIKYTKGVNHTISIYDKEGSCYYSFNFGQGGMTLISEETKKLKRKVIDFVLGQHIQMRRRSTARETKIEVFPPTPGLGHKDMYNVHMGGEFAGFFRSEEEIKSIFGPYEVYEKKKYVTGAVGHKATLKPLKEESLV